MQNNDKEIDNDKIKEQYIKKINMLKNNYEIDIDVTDLDLDEIKVQYNNILNNVNDLIEKERLEHLKTSIIIFIEHIYTTQLEEYDKKGLALSYIISDNRDHKFNVIIDDFENYISVPINYVRLCNDSRL